MFNLRLSFYGLLLGTAVLLVAGLLWYSNHLVSQLAEKEERLVRFWADAAEHIYNSTDADANFLLENVLLKDDDPMFYVPAILTDSSGQRPLMHNLEFSEGISQQDSIEQLNQRLEEMQSSTAYDPIRVTLPDSTYQLVFFRETDELRQLRYFPYITVVVVLLFLGFVFANVYLSQRSQLNKVWVGLAKETAHQLGTPISALMGWIGLLDANAETEDDREIVEELEKDVDKLNVIAERFSKIGSDPDLRPTMPGQLLERSVRYFQRRSASKVNITLAAELPTGFQMPLSAALLEWVIENLIKNALDAGATQVKLHAQLLGKQLIIEVNDNGRGISQKNARAIFRPGFTTKKRGWGLGLSLARRIVEHFHKGRIALKHSEPGKGTTFRITLPVS